MKPANTLQSLESLKVLGDPLRAEILRLLLLEAATLSQLGRALNLH